MRSVLAAISTATLFSMIAHGQGTAGKTVTRRALATSTIAAHATPATVTIVAIGARGDTLGQGSGFLVRGDGTIVTNWHVLKGASGAIVLLSTRERFSRVTFVDGDPALDIAIIKVPGYQLPVLETRSSTPDVGERIVAIGSPLGLSRTVTEGIVSATRLVDGHELVQISAAISPGSSGGAVLDDEGRVFAISSSFLEAGQQLNFAIPVRYAMGLLSGPPSSRAFAEVFATAEPDATSATRTASSGSHMAAANSLPERAKMPSPSVEGVYFLTQDWSGAGEYSGQRQWGLLIAGPRDGWLDLGWVKDDSVVYDEHVFRAENIRTNSAGDVAFAAGGVSYDGYQTDNGGIVAAGVVTTSKGERYALDDRLSRHTLPLSENSGLYDAQIRTRLYAGRRQTGNLDWSGEISVAQLKDSVYMDIRLSNSSGGSTGLLAWGPIGTDGSFHLTGVSGIKGDKTTYDFQGTVRAGVIEGTWVDDRKMTRFEGPLRAIRK